MQDVPKGSLVSALQVAKGDCAVMSGPLQAAIEHRIMHNTRFLGVPAQMNPMDAWVYQEIIHETRPNVIVELGNLHGGTLLYLARLCDMIGYGEVVGVDIARKEHGALHPRVTFIDGYATEVFDQVADLCDGRSVMVIEDSAHTYENTLDVLRLYGQLVKVGGYMVCEDGVMEPVAQALATFAAEQTEFVADTSREWPVTWNPGGYLKRVS